jgi:hypothetical protein
MLNCLNELKFSNTHSQNRIKKAYCLLGEKLVNKIIGFVFFLLGANRMRIAEKINIPQGTFLSLLTRIDNIGISAFGDRRSQASFQIQQPKPQRISISLKKDDQNLHVTFNNENKALIIPINNSLQSKVILLTFLNSGLLSLKDVSQALGFSTVRTRQLCTKLHHEDAHSLIDKRKGQLKDYVYTPEIKAEIIQQFAANAITGRSTSSQAISDQLNSEHHLKLSDRSVRLQIQKLGLHKILKSLPKQVNKLKKNSN